MTLDDLLNLLSDVAWKLVPIIVIILLIFIILLIRNVMISMKKLDNVMKKTEITIDTVNRQLEELDGPLHTINDLSNTVDMVHEASKHAVRSALVIIMDNFSSIKNKFTRKGEEEYDGE